MLKPLEKNQDLEKLSVAFAAEVKNFQEAKASEAPESDMKEACARLERMCSSLYEMIYNCHGRINQVDNYHWSSMNEHRSGHLPKLSPSQLKAALKTCGADEDFDVQKKVIWASRDSVTASYQKS